MASEPESKTVSELQELGILLVEDGNHGENRPRPDEFVDNGVKFIRAADMDGGRVLFEAAQCINAVARKRVRKGIGTGGDVLLSHKGTVGKVAYVPFDAPDFVCSPQTTFWRVTDESHLDRRYLYFYLQSREFVEQLDARKGETDMAPYVSLTNQRTLSVTMPPLPEQKTIARILGALDDKIELNRRMNATLEAMARALFQSWFVDFDPVHVLAGDTPEQPPFLVAEALVKAGFPASFQESSLGKIPTGWQSGVLGDIAINSRRTVHPKEIAPNTPYIALEHMPRHSIALGDWEPSAGVESSKTTFSQGEILFGKLRPYFHKVGVAPVSGVCSTDILVLAPKQPEWFGLLLGHASSDAAVRFADKHSTGTKMPRTNWPDLSSLKIAVPPSEVAGMFTRLIQPMVAQITANLHQSRTLGALLDTLLPKLLSGELPVAELSTEDERA